MHSTCNQRHPSQSQDSTSEAMKYKTDKVTTHRYHHLYQKYIGPIRTKPLKLLDIGLGCGMEWGVGASLYTWLEWLPNVRLYYLEYDSSCVRSFKEKLLNVSFFVGDQSDPVFLAKLVHETGGEFDIIVDVGGHESYQQIASLEALFPALKKGGMYFLEDILPRQLTSGNFTTSMYIQEILYDLITARFFPKRSGIIRDLYGVACQVDICVHQTLRSVSRSCLAWISSVETHGVPVETGDYGLRSEEVKEKRCCGRVGQHLQILRAAGIMRGRIIEYHEYFAADGHTMFSGFAKDFSDENGEEIFSGPTRDKRGSDFVSALKQLALQSLETNPVFT